MRHFLVVNPGSANGETGRRWPELSAKVSAAVGDFAHAFTSGPMDAARLTREALQAGHECITAVGGDGTLNEVVNGFFDAEGKPLNPAAALGLLPRGTGGDFRKTFGWDGELESALARLRTKDVQPLDVGLLEYRAHDGRTATRYFVNICSFGVSGLVDQEVNKRSKALGGKLSFMIGSARAMLKYADKRVRVSWDGGAPEELDVTTLAVANGKFFGGGMKVAPLADPADGEFDVTVWSGYSILDFVLKSKAMYDGSHVAFSGTRTRRCKELVADPVDGGEVLLDVDGEQPGRLPCRMSVLPGALKLKI
jgi:YegS/Rv2252/BmrU family lipid kinase